MAESCFLAKLKHYIELTESERSALRTLEEPPKAFAAGSVIYEEQESPAGNLYLVDEGRLHSSTALADGSRAILRIYYPGDIIGVNSIAFERSATTTVTSVPTGLCKFPRSRLAEVFENHPRLATLFYALAALENVALQDRLKSIGRTDGKSRIAALIMDVLSRLRTTSPDMPPTVNLMMTQGDIGDAVGLTNVHVHRCLKELADEGFIRRHGSEITVLREEELVERAHFINRYRSIDTSWFPPPAAG